MIDYDVELSVYKVLNGKTNGVPVFRKDTRDPDYIGDYIEIIPLDNDHESVIANGEINVNVHVPEQDKGIKNVDRIEEISDNVYQLFRQEKDVFSQYFTTFGKFTFSVIDHKDFKDDNKTYYRNFKIKVTYLNL